MKFSKVKAITKPLNFESIMFHKSIGMKLIGNGAIDGITIVFDYCGLGEHRVVFMKNICKLTGILEIYIILEPISKKAIFSFISLGFITTFLVSSSINYFKIEN